MNCPHCGTWSTVLATRSTRRRRECANGHRFSTVEAAVGLVGRPVRNWARDQAIKADKRGHRAVARAHGITEARVRQIRAAAQPRATS